MKSRRLQDRDVRDRSTDRPRRSRCRRMRFDRRITTPNGVRCRSTFLQALRCSCPSRRVASAWGRIVNSSATTTLRCCSAVGMRAAKPCPVLPSCRGCWSGPAKPRRSALFFRSALRGAPRPVRFAGEARAEGLRIRWCVHRCSLARCHGQIVRLHLADERCRARQVSLGSADARCPAAASFVPCRS